MDKKKYDGEIKTTLQKNIAEHAYMHKEIKLQEKHPIFMYLMQLMSNFQRW